MRKELIICFIIIISIVVGDVLLQKYTEKSLGNLNGKLLEFKIDAEKNNDFNKEKLKEINKEWEKNFKSYTCYLEHDELEKVKTQLVIIESGIKMDDRKFVFEEISRTIYIIDHIKTKHMLQLDSIL